MREAVLTMPMASHNSAICYGINVFYVLSPSLPYSVSLSLFSLYLWSWSPGYRKPISCVIPPSTCVLNLNRCHHWFFKLFSLKSFLLACRKKNPFTRPSSDSFWHVVPFCDVSMIPNVILCSKRYINPKIVRYITSSSSLYKILLCIFLRLHIISSQRISLNPNPFFPNPNFSIVPSKTWVGGDGSDEEEWPEAL